MYRLIATLALLASTSFAFVQNPSISYLSALKMSEAPAAPLTLNPEETACVFIEFQNEFTTEGGALYDAVKECMEKTGTLGNARRVMDTARAAGCTIIHVPIAFEKVRHFKFHRLISGYDFNLLTNYTHEIVRVIRRLQRNHMVSLQESRKENCSKLENGEVKFVIS